VIIDLFYFYLQKKKLKKQIKVKLEVAKFLQDTLETTALKSNKKRSDDTLTTQFVEFMKKVLASYFVSLTTSLISF
jgi:hypothetical protein